MRYSVPHDLYSIVLPNWHSPRLTDWEYGEALEYKEKRSFGAVVGPASPVRLRGKVVSMAMYFRREFHYDFVQYSDRPDDEHEKDRAFLWRSDHHYPEKVIGAACFRWRRYTDIGDTYALAWVWFHPYERRQGHLLGSWEYFRARFGDFVVEPPLSAAMRGFLDKHGWPNKAQEAVCHGR